MQMVDAAAGTCCGHDALDERRIPTVDTSDFTANLFSNFDGTTSPAEVTQGEIPDENLDENGQEDQDDQASGKETAAMMPATSATRASTRMRKQTKADLKRKAAAFASHNELKSPEFPEFRFEFEKF